MRSSRSRHAAAVAALWRVSLLSASLFSAWLFRSREAPASPPSSGAVAFARLDSVLAREPLAPGDTVRVTTLGRGEHSTVVLIQLAPGASVPGHVHRAHDETAHLVRGTARLRVGAEVRDLRPGDLAAIPPGTPHGAVAGPGGAAVVSVYAPVWNPMDRHRDPRGDP